ncbi:hypothetical protein QIA25_02185 [Borreliella spielmanii]|uniref:Uncharacterized protein n=1 Tax=Borreliella spielmanii A14S TaxID=498742 RepID=C0AQC5_9SPIR|nr:hypothetical protein [Borreliella spielmanii]EEF84828.1 conserved hypothetical protein [Borreliella spielmanii A14S]WKC83405.1 hypothetical protein QIA25_02185 [Borreliella spielmanii]
MFSNKTLFSQVAVVKEIEGKVSVIRNTFPVKLDLDDEIFEYDFIEVGENSKLRINLYEINGVSADLIFYSNTNSFMFYSSLKDLQDAKIYLFRGSVDAVIHNIVKGSSFSVIINNNLFNVKNAAKFYANSDYFNNCFINVYKGSVRHINKTEYLIFSNTSLLLFNGNSFLHKVNEGTLKGVNQNFIRMAKDNFMSLNKGFLYFFILKYIEDSFRFNFMYNYLMKDFKFNSIYSKWSLEDKNYKLGNRVDMINNVNYLKGRIGVLFNNFVDLSNRFYFVDDIFKYFPTFFDKSISVSSPILKFLKDYKANKNVLKDKFFKTIHSLKMYLRRSNDDITSNLNVNELHLLRPREF